MISFWIINFFFSNYQLIPNSDDVFYTFPALGFKHLNEISFTQFDLKYTFFERFPLYTLFLGIFYKIISPFLVLNFYTYKIINILIFILILISSFIIIKKFSKNNNFNKIIFFPLALSITPISQTYLSARPEYLGILFTLLGIYFFISEKNKFKLYKYEIAFFIFGLSILCHPCFLIFNFFIFLKFFFKNKLKKIIVCGFFNSLPIILLIFYYYINLPESLSQINLQAKGLPYFKAWKGLSSYSLDIFYNKDFLIGLINTYYYLPSLLLILYIFTNIKKIFSKLSKIKNNAVILSIFFSSIFLLILERNHPYLISISIFYLILFLFLIPWNTYFLNYILKKKNSFFIISFFIISSWNLIHLIKFNIYKERFLENTKLINLKKEIIKEKNPIFVTRPELAPYFIKEFDDQYKNKIEKDIFWLFPDNGRAKNTLEKEISEKNLNKLLNKYQNKKIYWLIGKKNFTNNCLTINDALNYSKSIKIKFSDIEKYYESNKHLIFTSNVTKFKENKNSCK